MELIHKVKLFWIRFLGLKGSWKWAKSQMLRGHIVRYMCSGTVKYKIDSANNGLLKWDFSEEGGSYKFESAYFHIDDLERITTWYILK